MALEGSLKEFNVADILQLIFFQKKTGVLLLQGREDRFRVLFMDGNIVGAESKTRGLEKRLIWIFLRRGIIDQAQLEAAIGKQKESGGKVMHILVRDGFVDRDEAMAILSFLVQEIMVRIFSLHEGRYEFKPQAIPIDKELGVVLNTEHFLMEGVRLVDEWTEIEGKIFLKDVFVRDDEEEVKLSEEEERVYDYIDGVNDISDIADISGMDSFSAASTLLGLLERGAIYRMKAEEPTHADTAKGKKQARPIPALTPVLILLLLSGLVASFLLLFQSQPSLKEYEAAVQAEKIRLEILTARQQNGTLPASINHLDPWGQPFVYTLVKNSDGSAATRFTLYSTGADKTPGTADDIY